MTSTGQFPYVEYPCPRCGGPVRVDEDILPDKTYELVCIQCSNRNFPAEIEIAINMIIKLNGSYNN
jgi:DNA-directed RNA polymerase subunit RPC12/RpoP